MSKPLTVKQEKFAINIANGMNRVDAYRNAYNAENMTDRSVHQKSFELLQNGEVTVKINSIKSELAKRELWSREDSINKLKEALDLADRPNDIVAVIKELNNMHGFAAPKKVEYEGEMRIAKIERVIVKHEN